MNTMNIDQEKARVYFRNLYIIAMADRQLAKEETSFLVRVAQQMGIGVRESTEIMMSAGKAELVIPEEQQERLTQLEDIVMMMMVDKKIHDLEYDLCFKFAKTIGMDKKGFDMLILKIATGKEA